MTDTYQEFELQPCSVCGRNFRVDIVNRHEAVCLKSTSKKRKVFDSGKQRAKGVELPMTKFTSDTTNRERETKLAQIANKKHNWRQKHEEFINAIRAAKQYTVAKQKGQPLPPPPPASIDPDLIQCEYCLRRFSEKAAERHIPFCRDKHARVPASGQTGIARPKPAQRNTSGIPSRGGDSIRSRTGANAVNRRGTASLLPSTSSQETEIVSNASTNAYPNRVSSNLPRRGNSQPSKVARSPSNMIAQSGSIRGTINPINARARPSASPNLGSDAIRPNCPQSLATGRARAISHQPTHGRTVPSTGMTNQRSATGTGSQKFCHECGSQFPSNVSKFCPECGVRRLNV